MNIKYVSKKLLRILSLPQPIMIVSALLKFIEVKKSNSFSIIK